MYGVFTYIYPKDYSQCNTKNLDLLDQDDLLGGSLNEDLCWDSYLPNVWGNGIHCDLRNDIQNLFLDLTDGDFWCSKTFSYLLYIYINRSGLFAAWPHKQGGFQGQDGKFSTIYHETLTAAIPTGASSWAFTVIDDNFADISPFL